MSEFLPVSPIVGTVNLEGANDAAGGTLAEHQHHRGARRAAPAAAQQRDDHRRASRCLASTARSGRSGPTSRSSDSTKPTGWKFANDGTRLWPDLDGRPSLAGMARTVSDPNTRNIYTFIPNGSGGGSTVAFTSANATLLASHLGVTDATTLITSVRAQPLGRGDRVDAGVDGRAVARSAARRRLRVPEFDRHVCRRSQGPARDAVLRRQRRDDPRGRRQDRLRGVGVHSLQPAAEAQDAARRSAGGAVRLLRGQLAEDSPKSRSAAPGRRC